MTKNEHIHYWITTAETDWQRAQRCFNDEDFVFCLFCIHLSLEKTCKAVWVKNNESNIPPKTHNLVKLLKGTRTPLTESDLIFLNDLNRFQLEGRYPDYKLLINKIATADFTTAIKNHSEKIKICLTEMLQ